PRAACRSSRLPSEGRVANRAGKCDSPGSRRRPAGPGGNRRGACCASGRGSALRARNRGFGRGRARKLEQGNRVGARRDGRDSESAHEEYLREVECKRSNPCGDDRHQARNLRSLIKGVANRACCAARSEPNQTPIPRTAKLIASPFVGSAASAKRGFASTTI